MDVGTTTASSVHSRVAAELPWVAEGLRGRLAPEVGKLGGVQPTPNPGLPGSFLLAYNRLSASKKEDA